jgi:CCR4-NOT transcription complex subunit 2
MPNSRPLGQVASQRAQQQSMLPTQQQTQAQQQAQQQQQDDLFSSSSQLPNSQTGFRFGSQSAVGQISQSQSSGPDDFPPLNRNVNGEIGQDRAPGLLQNVGFGHLAGSPSFGGGGALQSTRSNGLLNAVASNARPPASNTQGPSPSPSLGGNVG